jgi:hypothetical protein
LVSFIVVPNLRFSFFLFFFFAPSKSPVMVQPKVLHIFLLRKLYVAYLDCGQASLRVMVVTWIDLNSLAFLLNLFNHFFIVSRFVCSFFERMYG